MSVNETKLLKFCASIFHILLLLEVLYLKGGGLFAKEPQGQNQRNTDSDWTTTECKSSQERKIEDEKDCKGIKNWVIIFFQTWWFYFSWQTRRMRRNRSTIKKNRHEEYMKSHEETWRVVMSKTRIGKIKVHHHHHSWLLVLYWHCCQFSSLIPSLQWLSQFNLTKKCIRCWRNYWKINNITCIFFIISCYWSNLFSFCR